MRQVQIYSLLFFILAMLFCAARLVPDWTYNEGLLFGILSTDPAQNIFTFSYAVILLLGGYYSSALARLLLTVIGTLLVINSLGLIISGDMYSRILIGLIKPSFVVHKSTLFDVFFMSGFGFLMALVGLMSFKNQKKFYLFRKS